MRLPLLRKGKTVRTVSVFGKLRHLKQNRKNYVINM